EKDSFSVSSFSCPGYVVDSYGFEPDSHRLTSLVNVSSPAYIHESRSVLSALQYYLRFIPNFAQCAALFDVLSINNYCWFTNHEKTFRILLRRLQTIAVLKLQSVKDHSTLIIDASPIGICTVLEQCGRAVTYILHFTERGYS
ncbi:uncharacterized protein DEA37_0014236, partial [Paragonimus westermani]